MRSRSVVSQSEDRKRRARVSSTALHMSAFTRYRGAKSSHVHPVGPGATPLRRQRFSTASMSSCTSATSNFVLGTSVSTGWSDCITDGPSSLS